jgi:hypothetical protein
VRVFGSECASNKSIHEDVASVDKRLRIQSIRRHEYDSQSRDLLT